MSRILDLIQQCQAGDEQARETILQENSGLIWAITKRYLGRGPESDDLFQVGCRGFLQAVDGFDISFGTQCSTYAVPKISGEIRRFLRDDGTLKVSRGIKERAAIIKIANDHLSQMLGREATISELSAETGFSIEEISVAECATASVESIHQDNGGDGFTLECVLSDTDSEESMLEKIALRQAIEKLNERERTVIQLRYFHGLTQDRISKLLSVSQVQVSRIEKRAIERLREYLK